jgi:hypothetical protein
MASVTALYFITRQPAKKLRGICHALRTRRWIPTGVIRQSKSAARFPWTMRRSAACGGDRLASRLILRRGGAAERRASLTKTDKLRAAVHAAETLPL